MNFDLSEDQALLKASVERCVAGFGGLHERQAARRQPRGFADTHWSRLADAGVLALAVSAEKDGLGGDRASVMLAMEAVGRALVAEPVLDAAVVAASLLDRGGHTPAHAAALAAIIAGTGVTVLAHAERAARFEIGHVGTTATEIVGTTATEIVGTTATAAADRTLLAGTKIAVLHGGAANQIIVSAHATDTIGLWLVDADADGLDRRPYRLADGSLAAEITLRNVEVNAADRLHGGMDTLYAVAALARAAAAAEMLGLMTLLFDTTLAHVKTRTQFGQPLGHFQVIQHRMVDAYVLVEQARSQVMRAMLASDAEFPAAAAGAKAFVAEAALLVAHDAVQLHGGMGITDELVIGHALKRIRVLALTFGDTASAVDAYRETETPAWT